MMQNTWNAIADNTPPEKKGNSVGVEMASPDDEVAVAGSGSGPHPEQAAALRPLESGLELSNLFISQGERRYNTPGHDRTSNTVMVGPGASPTSPLPDSTALHARLDSLERELLDRLPPVHLPVEHDFMPFLYRRTITMAPGALLTSKIHRTEHPYAVLRGCAMVLVLGQEPQLLEAGHQGVTQAMTRRALFIPAEIECDGEIIPNPEPCVWSTCHVLSPEEEQMRKDGATTEELLAAIEARIIEPHLHLDGADAHQKYVAALKNLGLPGPHDGARALQGEVE